jgi:hypothetical protein
MGHELAQHAVEVAFAPYEHEGCKRTIRALTSGCADLT